jgi:hypothetical protein
MNIFIPFEFILLAIVFAAGIIGILTKRRQAYIVVFFGLSITVIYLLGEHYQHETWWGGLSVIAAALFARHLAETLEVKNT